ncbi:MAG: GNAT family N-acetyltransferase [Henriciella sp.]|uniref:GNAT family N-acetyltransferase n=1 Tax=Henriciella sp. TaxID=1968823 RepID=UPI003C713BD2
MTDHRELRPGDIPEIVAHVREAGFPQRSEAGWRWALFDNPEQDGLPAGHGAFKDGRLVSMLGLQTRRFHFGGSTIVAASGHTFISSEPSRGAGLILARKVLADERYAAIYTLNNNARSSRFYERLGLSPWLGPHARKWMEWPVHSVTRAAGLALSRLARHDGLYKQLSGREWFQSGPRALGRMPGMSGPVVRLTPSRAEDAKLIDAFDRAVHSAHSIAPVRTADVYAYQMNDPDAPGRTALFGLMREDRLEGLMQVVMSKPNAFEPTELQIIDLKHLPGCDGALIIPPLVQAARQLARRHRLSRVRLPLSDRFEPVCFEGTGLRYERAAKHDAAHAIFAKGVEQLERRWVPTGFEGDFFFALRILPERRRHRVRSPSQEVAQAGSAFVERRRPIQF